jgi:hypothetical protein
MLRISVIFQITSARTANPKDFKNATFDALSLVFFVQPVVDLILPTEDVVVTANIVLSLASLFSTSISYAVALSLSSYMQSYGNFFSSKIEQSSVLVDYA